VPVDAVSDQTVSVSGIEKNVKTDIALQTTQDKPLENELSVSVENDSLEEQAGIDSITEQVSEEEIVAQTETAADPPEGRQNDVEEGTEATPENTSVILSPLSIEEKSEIGLNRPLVLRDDVIEQETQGEPEVQESQRSIAVGDDTRGQRGNEEKSVVEAEPTTEPEEIEGPGVEPVVIAEIRKRNPSLQQLEIDTKKPATIAPVKIDFGAESSDEESGGSGENLFQERLNAGEEWLSRDEKQEYTIQLMMLSATEGERNLKNNLQEQEYKDIADELFIIKSEDAKVFVFFGEYQSPEEARQARNTLPLFLREYDPYPLSVQDAVNKTISPE